MKDAVIYGKQIVKEVESASKSKRENWVDCAKLVAIIGVVVDHCNMLFYTNQWIAAASYYSVSLFVLLSSITAKMNERNTNCIPSLMYILKRIGKTCLQYAFATFVLLAYYVRFFDLKTYISHLLNFSIQLPYYFLVFYFQLLLISPVLLSWNKYCNGKKYHIIWNMGTLIFWGWLSSVTIHYTYILPVWGGGQFLFGGTYIILYYLGMVLSGYRVFERSQRGHLCVFVASGVAWILVWRMIGSGRRPLDSLFDKLWGYGYNPPSIQFMLFGIATLFLSCSLFSIIWKRGGADDC